MTVAAIAGSTTASRRQDEADAYYVLFCGIPAQEQYCGFNADALAYSIEWSPERFKSALDRLAARGHVLLRYDPNGHGHAHAVQHDPRWLHAVRAPIPVSLRFFILRRDEYRCQLCGLSAQDGAQLEIDHRVAVALGGTNDPDNLWTLCWPCNRGKGTEEL